MKKILSFLLAAVMCFSVIGVIPAKAATEKNTNIGWFGGQNGNPWSGSNWTFHTGKDGKFTKMMDFITAENAPASIKAAGWWADANGETAYIGTWRQQATQEKWAVTAFNIAEDGNIAGTSGVVLKTNGAGAGDVMVVLKNAQGFYPVWPAKGEWTWQTVTDTTGISVDFTTGYKSGDTLYYIVKPAENVDLTRIEICPSLTFTGGAATDYPATFTAFGGNKVEIDVIDAALKAPKIIINPTEVKYQDGNRLWQGIPGIAKDNRSGRLWSAWYSGGFQEDEYNWVTLSTSNDDGESWSSPKLVITPDYPVRAFDPNLWMDPDGRMWLFWSQSYYNFDGRCGVWAMCTENPEDENPTWSEPKRIANGIAMNDPIVLSNQKDSDLNGAWLLPTSVWVYSQRTELGKEINANAYVSLDQGQTWSYRGSVEGYEDGTKRQYDENMIVEKKDGTLIMFIRTLNGITKSTSVDGGKTWTDSVGANLTTTCSRFNVKRLASGNLLLVYHEPEILGRRTHLIAAVSEDDGVTWTHKLMLDERWGVSYPDVQQDTEGNIYIIYDFGRTSKSNILFAKITEKDIKAGKLVTSTSKLRCVINNNTDELATVKTASGEISEIITGKQIFNDSNYTFAGILREWFMGKAYLCASLENGFTAEVETDGWLYVLTPATGDTNSQQQKLEEQGFENIIDIKQSVVSSGIKVPMAFMAKKVKAGEKISCEKWSILVQKLSDEKVELKCTDISWFARQNAQPWSGSRWTFEYFNMDTGKFSQLETYLEDKNPAYWQDTTGAVQIKSWEQVATNKKYSAVAYNAEADGIVQLTNNTTVSSKNADGQLMIVQRSAGKYHVLLDWITISTGQSVTLPNIEAYLKAGDIVYYVYRATSNNYSIIGMIPSVSYKNGVKDEKNLYPTEWEDLPYLLFEEYKQTDSEKLAALKKVLQGKNISILGDSISTYAGYSNDAVNTNSTIGDNAIYYGSERLKSVNDTWWKQTADNTGMNVLVNNSWSGSRVLAKENSAGYKDRAVNLHDNTGDNAGTMPDVIAIYLGINDYSGQLEAGTYSSDFANTLVIPNGDGTYTYAEPTNVAEAYYIMLHKITTTYPDADVFFMSLMPITWRTDENATSDLVKYNANIKAIAKHFGVNFVDLNGKSGITLENCKIYTLDGGHPNVYGMDLMTATLEEAMYDQYIAKTEDRFTGMTLNLDGTIGFNFYVNSDNALSKDAYVAFELPSGMSQTVAIGDAVETSNGLKFTCHVPAKEMADVITATLYDGDKVVDAQFVSVRDYAQAILKNETKLDAYTTAQPLVKAMLNYGAYSQKLFEYNMENLANDKYETDTVVQSVKYTDLAEFCKAFQGLTGFGKLAGATLILEGETTLRMFFALEDGAELEGLRFTVNGIEQPYKRSGNYYIVEFANIAANELDKDFTVTVSAGSNSFDASCSAMTYCYNALVNSDNVALQDAVKALYLYHAEAKAYFY